MNHLTLTHDQVEQIQTVHPLFDEEEIVYDAIIDSRDDSFSHELGTEVISTPVIRDLKVLIGKDWVKLIEREDDVDGALFEITSEQFWKIIKNDR